MNYNGMKLNSHDEVPEGLCRGPLGSLTDGKKYYLIVNRGGFRLREYDLEAHRARKSKL